MATEERTTAPSAPLPPVLTQLSPLADIAAVRMALRLANRIDAAYAACPDGAKHYAYREIHAALRAAGRRR
jgi:hypothetical protein